MILISEPVRLGVRHADGHRKWSGAVDGFERSLKVIA